MRWSAGAAGLEHASVWDQLHLWNSLPGVQVAAAADPDPTLLAHARDSLGIRRLYPSWEEMLKKEDLHFLQVGLPPCLRADLVEEAAARGIHCALPGPMAASLDGSERMLTAARRHRVFLVIDWPAIRNPALHHAARLVEEESIGPIYHVWQRSSSRAKAAGWGSAPAVPEIPETAVPDEESPRITGALLECCSAGANLCRTLIGVPSYCMAALARAGRNQAAPEDTAVLVMSYTAAIGTAEGTLVEAPDEGLPEIILRGSSGSLLITGDKLRLARTGARGPVEVEVPPLPERVRHAPELLLNAAMHGIEVQGFGNPQVGRDTQEMLEAGLLSLETRRPTRLPLR